MNFRKHFDYDVKAASDDARTGDFGPSLTVQEHSIDADINEMMRRVYRDWETDRKSTRLNSSHRSLSRMPSSA